ncbi:MAG: response regulator [Arcobacteraceae bacterium]|jgi:CheY-like chemotaxis protein
MNIELIKTLRVLYVEDEIALRDITSSSIESIISKLVVADNGKEGLDKFSDEEFDLVITDLSMPVMDGLTMIKEIRKINATIPIVVTTAFGSQNEEVEKLQDVGMSAYVMKPVDVMKLLQTIDEAIAQ